MVRLLLALALSCITAHSAAQTAGGATAGAATVERTAAGKVELAEGDVRFLDASRRTRRPGVGDVVYEGDSIVTGSNGEVHLRMEDGGYVAVRPGTRMRIVNFRAEGDAEDRSVIALLEGSFRSVTGWIAKQRRDRVVVNTPTATIGIRGTEHEPLVIPEGSRLGEAGTYDRVHAGETEIRTKQGTVSVRPNQAGFAGLRGVQRPRVLDRVPAFFRPTRNETRFAGLHERVSRQLDQHREERRRFVEERRKVQQPRPDTGKSAKGAKGTDKGERKQLEQRRDEKQRGEQIRDEKKQRLQDRQSERDQAREDRKRGTDRPGRERADEEKKQRSKDRQSERGEARDDKKQRAAEPRRERAEQGRADKKDHAKGGK
jgi:hypothetical protein